MSERFRVPRALARQLQEHHVPVAAVLRRARLPEGFFSQEKILVTTEELFALWWAVGEISGDPAIGLKLGADPRVGGGSPQLIAALHSESFLDAVQRLARYKKLTCPEEIRWRPAQGECAVEFVFLLGDNTEPPTLVDLCLSWILHVGRRGTGVPITPLRLELTRAPAHRTILEGHFGCRAKFQAPRNALVFRPSDLARAFVTHDPELLALIAPQMEAELSLRHASCQVGDEVKAVLKRLLAGRRPALDDVAAKLGWSARTLQRRLTGDGVTFQGLLQEVRRDLARHHLGQSRLALNEIAYLLGFDDANSFFRAFQRWEGTSPRRWRHRHQPTRVKEPATRC